MSDDDVTWALRQLGRAPGPADRLAGSMSGSGVFRVRLDPGPGVDEPVDAVLKIARDEPHAVASTRHELSVYTELGPSLPVTTPRLIDHHVDDRSVVLLLSAHRPAEPATAWTEQDWWTVADDLAALHDLAPSTGNRWPHGSWVLDTLARPDHDLLDRFWVDEREVVDAVLHDAPGLADVIRTGDLGLIHGDCHTGNLLREPAGLVWIDWQGTRVGRPADDLAFLSVRGVPDGAVVPVTAMVDRYASARGLAAGPLQAAVLATELVELILSWPHYAGFNSSASIARVRGRVLALAAQWLRR